MYTFHRLQGSKIRPEYNTAFLHEGKNRMGYHRRYRRVFLDISNNIQPRAQTKWKVLKWYRGRARMQYFTNIEKFRRKNTTRFLMFREFIESSTMSFAICLCPNDLCRRSSAPNFPSFFSSLTTYVITPNFFFFIFPKFKIRKNKKQFLNPKYILIISSQHK